MIDTYVWLAAITMALVANVALFWFGKSALRWLALAIALMLIVAGYQTTRLVVINLAAGCYPWSPAVVPYQDGMTLCPGQSAVATMSIPHAAIPRRAPLLRGL